MTRFRTLFLCKQRKCLLEICPLFHKAGFDTRAIYRGARIDPDSFALLQKYLMLSLFFFFSFGALQASSDELNRSNQVLPGGEARLDQVVNIITPEGARKIDPIALRRNVCLVLKRFITILHL